MTPEKIIVVHTLNVKTTTVVKVTAAACFTIGACYVVSVISKPYVQKLTRKLEKVAENLQNAG